MHKQLAKIGFQLPDHNIRSVTGFCAAEMAIKEANALETFPFQIELVPIIDRRTTEVARDAAHRFAEDPAAVGVLGPLNSAMAVATQKIYHDAGLAQLTSEASSPLLTENGYENFFRLVAKDQIQGRALAQTAMFIIKAEQVVVLHDDSAWGRPIADVFTAELRANGIEPVLFYGFGEPEHALNFDSLISATMAASPDLVYFAVYWNKAHIIAHKLRYAGLSATFLGSDALKPYAFLEVPSLDKEPPYHTLAGVDMRLKPSSKSFLSLFAHHYPTLLAAPQYAAEAYDCARLLITALQRGGTIERRRLVAELRALGEFEGAIGIIRFDNQGDLIDPEIGLYRCIDGQRHHLGSVEQVIKEAS